MMSCWNNVKMAGWRDGGWLAAPPPMCSAPCPLNSAGSAAAAADLPIQEDTLDPIRWFIPILNRLPWLNRHGLGDRLVANLYGPLEQQAALRLRAHPVQPQIRRCREGASFMGFVVRPGRLRVRNHNLCSGRRRLQQQRRALLAGTLSVTAARISLLSWTLTWPVATPGGCGAGCLRAWPRRPTYPEAGRVAQLLRGGSWNNDPRNCRSATRNHNQPDNANNNVGFRVACLPQDPSINS